MPRFLVPIYEGMKFPEDTSIVVVDNRDDRMVSPFQAWLVSEIMSNAASSINVLTERDQVMPPNSGFSVALFANYTLDGIKVVLALSLESETGTTCAGWDGETAAALSHQAFQPFTWPMLRDTSASYTDVKIYNGNEILFHWIFRGFRSDTDLTVQRQFVDEHLVREVNQGKPRLSVVIAVFIGYRVSVLSFECGGRTYSVGPRGSVVAGDSARSRFELRCCSRSTADAVGNDADRVEFRFRDSNNRIDLKCSRTSVPGTWLTVSHISGPTLIKTIQSVRENKARVEGPEQTEQFAQLAAIHQTWWETSVASSEDQVGSMVVFIPGMEEGNFHVQARSKLLVREPEVVPAKALAEMQHGEAVKAPTGPPSLTGEAWLSSAETVANMVSSSKGSEEIVPVRQQANYELNFRSFATKHPQEGKRGHVVDAERDRARCDRRFARSTAQLTPQLFHEEISRRSYNVSTATIEEVDAELLTPPEDWAAWGKENVVEDAVADRPALSKVPHSAPAVGSTECSDQAAPTTAPQSFGPSAQTGQDVEAEVTVE